MSENSIGPVLAVVAVIGACSLCVLGPAFFVGVVASASGWFAGIRPVFGLGLGLLVAFAAYRLWHAWGKRDRTRVESDAGETP